MRQEADGNVGIMTKQIPEAFCFFFSGQYMFSTISCSKRQKIEIDLGKEVRVTGRYY